MKYWSFYSLMLYVHIHLLMLGYMPFFFFDDDAID